jgi:hypothetical protein
MAARNYYQLREPYTQSYDYCGAMYGHPSTHASVRFECTPAESLSFESIATWPSSLPRDYCARLECAICYAIVEGLLGVDIYPYQGCALALVEIDWDDVASSEAAFYIATKLAMQYLIARAPWNLRTPSSSIARGQ